MDHVTDLAPGMANASEPLEGVATAGQPRKEDLEKLAGAGYGAVVDLRASGEERGFDEAEAVGALGMEYVNLPVTTETPDDATFGRFREVMKDARRRPVLVHCGSANRVGALLLPHLILDRGKSPQEAVEEARRVGLRSAALEGAALRYAERRGRGEEQGG